jgi:hypothetical protein
MCNGYKRLPCPKCGGVSRAFDVGVKFFATLTATVGMTIERNMPQAQQQAVLRGMTVGEFLAALEGSVEIVWDPV